MDKALVLAKELKALRDRVAAITAVPIPLNGKDGDKGDKGDKGERGDNGTNGLNGKNGLDGKDGIDGKQGVSVVDAYLAADNSLIIKLSSGAEIDVGSLDLFSPSNASVSVLKQTQDSAQLASLFVSKTFETTSKNLVSASAVLNYTDGVLSSIVYGNGITKTFTYSSGILTTITLSGTTPAGISLNKNLNYTSGTLSSISYS